MKALLIVDLQNDFLPGGALGIPNGDQIIPVINALQDKFDLIVATKDWHPPGHISFASRDGIWPDHCVQNTFGAEFAPTLKTDKISHIVHKGSDPDVDSYSTFADNAGKESGLAAYLKEQGVDEIYIVGLATDYCVRFSVHDALKAGFKVMVIKEGCMGIEDSEHVFEELKRAGAIILPTLS